MDFGGYKKEVAGYCQKTFKYLFFYLACLHLQASVFIGGSGESLYMPTIQDIELSYYGLLHAPLLGILV